MVSAVCCDGLRDCVTHVAWFKVHSTRRPVFKNSGYWYHWLYGYEYDINSLLYKIVAWQFYRRRISLYDSGWIPRSLRSLFFLFFRQVLLAAGGSKFSGKSYTIFGHAPDHWSGGSLGWGSWGISQGSWDTMRIVYDSSDNETIPPTNSFTLSVAHS